MCAGTADLRRTFPALPVLPFRVCARSNHPRPCSSLTASSVVSIHLRCHRRLRFPTWRYPLQSSSCCPSDPGPNAASRLGALPPAECRHMQWAVRPVIWPGPRFAPAPRQRPARFQRRELQRELAFAPRDSTLEYYSTTLNVGMCTLAPGYTSVVNQ